jgi:hypothetical protein
MNQSHWNYIFFFDCFHFFIRRIVIALWEQTLLKKKNNNFDSHFDLAQTFDALMVNISLEGQP